MIDDREKQCIRQPMSAIHTSATTWTCRETASTQPQDRVECKSWCRTMSCVVSKVPTGKMIIFPVFLLHLILEQKIGPDLSGSFLVLISKASHDGETNITSALASQAAIRLADSAFPLHPHQMQLQGLSPRHTDARCSS